MNEQKTDNQVLLMCEDLMNVLQSHRSELGDVMIDADASPLARRIGFIKERIETERRMIEDISRPGRLLLEHFSMFLEKVDYTIGFDYGDVRAGRGMLANMRIGEWGVVTLEIGDVKVTWRDADVSYMFYPDRIIIRPKDSGQDDITFFFSYFFKYNKESLKRFQDVAEDEQTLYWHEGLHVSQ